MAAPHSLRRFVWALPVWLAACSTLPASPPRTPLSQVDPPTRDWAGRFSIHMAHVAEQRQDASMGRFVLRTQDSASGPILTLELASPLGQTMARGRRQANGQASLELADGRHLEADGLDALLHHALGWSLPIERLPLWLDDRFEAILDRDANGHITRAQDSGWQIERTPGRWALQRPTTQGSLRIVLILDRPTPP